MIDSGLLLIEIQDVPFGDRVLRRHEPLILNPSRSEDDGCYGLDVEELDMSFSAESIDELISEVEGLIAAMWRQYVMRESARLTPGALELRRRLTDNYGIV